MELLIPFIEKQTQLVKVALPEFTNAAVVERLAEISKLHIRRLADVAKQVKKLDKEAKQLAKSEVKKRAQPSEPKPETPAVEKEPEDAPGAHDSGSREEAPPEQPEEPQGTTSGGESAAPVQE